MSTTTLDVTCPTCGAPPDEYCLAQRVTKRLNDAVEIGWGFSRRMQPHDSRVN